VVVQNAAQVNVGAVQQNAAPDSHGVRERVEARLAELDARRNTPAPLEPHTSKGRASRSRAS
jgi:hypothetical protein